LLFAYPHAGCTTEVADQVAQAKPFVKKHGRKFGLEWDDRTNWIRIGPRDQKTGETTGQRDNSPGYHGAGRWLSDPLPFLGHGDKARAARSLTDDACTSPNRSALMVAKVQSVFATMKDADVAVLKLRHFDRLTLKQIALHYGSTYQAAQRRLDRAQKNFQAAMAPPEAVEVPAPDRKPGRPARDHDGEAAAAGLEYGHWVAEAEAVEEEDTYLNDTKTRPIVKRVTSKNYEGSKYTEDDSIGSGIAPLWGDSPGPAIDRTEAS
jgi:hypothetical protein